MNWRANWDSKMMKSLGATIQVMNTHECYDHLKKYLKGVSQRERKRNRDAGIEDTEGGDIKVKSSGAVTTGLANDWDEKKERAAATAMEAQFKETGTLHTDIAAIDPTALIDHSMRNNEENASITDAILMVCTKKDTDLTNIAMFKASEKFRRGMLAVIQRSTRINKKGERQVNEKALVEDQLAVINLYLENPHDSTWTGRNGITLSLHQIVYALMLSMVPSDVLKGRRVANDPMGRTDEDFIRLGEELDQRDMTDEDKAFIAADDDDGSSSKSKGHDKNVCWLCKTRIGGEAPSTATATTTNGKSEAESEEEAEEEEKPKKKKHKSKKKDKKEKGEEEEPTTKKRRRMRSLASDNEDEGGESKGNEAKENETQTPPTKSADLSPEIMQGLRKQLAIIHARNAEAKAKAEAELASKVPLPDGVGDDDTESTGTDVATTKAPSKKQTNKSPVPTFLADSDTDDSNAAAAADTATAPVDEKEDEAPQPESEQATETTTTTAPTAVDETNDEVEDNPFI